MKVRIVRMRQRGRRVPEVRVRADPGQLGELITELVAGGRESVLIARLRPLSAPLAADLLPPLYAPNIVRIATLALCLRGFEVYGEGAERASTIQEWLCSPSD